MTHPAPPPATPDETPTPTGRTMLVVRGVIAVGLAVGVLVFGLVAINELSKGAPPPTGGRDFGAATGAPAPSTPPKNTAEMLRGLAKPNPDQFIPILRENPHPGEISPYQSADAYLQPPYRQPAYNGEVWELCAYRVQDGEPQEAFAYYDTKARQMGLERVLQEATSDNTPGGLRARWSDGKRTLELTAWPTPNAPPGTARPPLRAPTPLDWVVKYSYPQPTND